VQLARRDADLAVTDRISVTVDASPAVGAAVEAHRDFLAGEVLATEVALAEVGDDGFTGEVGEDETIRVAVRVA
jgi:isoleucyl-tRNA synthetase